RLSGTACGLSGRSGDPTAPDDASGSYSGSQAARGGRRSSDLGWAGPRYAKVGQWRVGDAPPTALLWNSDRLSSTTENGSPGPLPLPKISSIPRRPSGRRGS